MSVLGFTLSDDLIVTRHITEVLVSCSRSLYAIRILKSHGLPPLSIQEVTRATTLAQFLYDASAWRGFISASDSLRIERFLSSSCCKVLAVTRL